MAHSAIGSDHNDHDLKFLAEIKSEGSSEKTSAHIPDAVYLGMRRNSSFADYFEGDLSQNLLSRRCFPTLSDYSSSSSDHQDQEVINSLVNKIQNDNKNTITTPLPSRDKKSTKFSEIITGHWFFTNGKLDFRKRKGQRRTRTISLPCDGAEDDDDRLDEDEGSVGLSLDDQDPGRGSLTRLVSRHFSASSDMRAFNISSPQSQWTLLFLSSWSSKHQELMKWQYSSC